MPLAPRSRIGLPLTAVIVAGIVSSYLLNRAISRNKQSRLESLGGSKMNGTHTTTKDLPPFKMTFAVPMHCQSCVDDLEAAVSRVEGITDTSASISSATLTTTGNAPPSQILSAIASTGRDAIVRGSGASNSAAVAILEIYGTTASSSATVVDQLNAQQSPVRGLARLVQVGPRMTVVDISLSGVGFGRWGASVREKGDVSRGLQSTGAVWNGRDSTSSDNLSERERKGWIGEVVVNEEGRGGIVGVGRWEVWEVVGRGLVLERLDDEGLGNVAGVIARSAGVWDNEKTVCSCSGKTVWEEREEQKGRGML